MDKIKDGGFLSSYVIYSLPFLFLLPMNAGQSPWWPFPTIGPFFLSFSLALILLVLYLYENLSGGKKISITLERKVFIFWLLHTFSCVGLVVIGVRSSLDSIGARLYSGIGPYFLALMVFLVIRNNGWKLHNYERVVKGFLLVSLVWVVESFVVAYLRIPIPGLNSIDYMGESGFSSGITNSLHIVSKASLVAVWLCIYMYLRYGLRRYMFLGVCNFFVIASTLNRVSIAACILSIIFFGYFLYVKFPSKIITKKIRVLSMMKGALLALLVITVIGVGQFVVKYKGFAPYVLQGVDVVEVADAADLGIGYVERLYQYVRATEVIVQYPLGIGAGLGYLMCYSKDAKVIFSDELRQAEPFLTFSKYYQSGIFGIDLQQRKVRRAFTIHNATLNWLLDYGIFGFLLLVGYFYWLVRYYKFSIFLMRKKYNNLGRIYLSLLLCQLSVFLAVQSTHKFHGYWIFVFLFLFSMSIYRSFIEEQRKQLPNQE